MGVGVLRGGGGTSLGEWENKKSQSTSEHSYMYCIVKTYFFMIITITINDKVQIVA